MARTVERGFRFALAVIFLVGLRRRDLGAVVNAVLSFVGTYLPAIVERRYGVVLEPWQRVYTESAMVTHALGMLGPYDDVQWWDHLTHTHTATLLGGAVHAIARRRGRDPRPRVLAIVVVSGVVWEIVEYVIHVGAARFGVEPVLVSYGKTDTLLDLVFNLVGALIVLVIGDYALGNLTTDADDSR